MGYILNYRIIFILRWTDYLERDGLACLCRPYGTSKHLEMAQAQVVSASFVDNVMFVSLSFKKKFDSNFKLRFLSNDASDFNSI